MGLYPTKSHRDGDFNTRVAEGTMPTQADKVNKYICMYMYPFYRSAFPAWPAATKTAMFSKTGRKKQSSLKKREAHPGAWLVCA